jgi:hypothetical protein
MWCWAFISIFFSLHPLISIKQLSATTAERIGVVLQLSGSTTPVGAIILYLYQQQVWCYTANSTNWSGATCVKIYRKKSNFGHFSTFTL